MALKTRFYDDEKVGFTSEELKIGEKYLRKNKTKAVISEIESLKLYEIFMVGASFHEIHQQFPQYEVGQIILTAAIRKWGLDREKIQHTLRDRVRAKVVKSVLEQVDFLTHMLSVTNVEYIDDMRKYILDPANNPAPDLRIRSIKEYKDVSESLAKIVQGATPGQGGKASAMFDALSSVSKNYEAKTPKKEETFTLDDALEEDDGN